LNFFTDLQLKDFRTDLAFRNSEAIIAMDLPLFIIHLGNTSGFIAFDSFGSFDLIAISSAVTRENSNIIS
jgi:hypothetical protein